MMTFLKQYQLILFATLFAVIFLIFPQYSITYLSKFTHWVSVAFDNTILRFSSFVLLMCLAIIISPLGARKLGDAEDNPEFNFFSWVAMLFTAGMGSGLIFWGVAEPVFHYANPPAITPIGSSPENTALALTYFHWGIHAWSLYAISGLMIGWVAFVKKRPMRISAIFTDNSEAGWWVIVDVVAVLAILFGVAGTLANTMALVQTGVEQIFAITFSGATFRFIMTLVIVVLFSLSSMLGLKQGIKRLSQFNILLMLLLFTSVMMFDPIGSFLTRIFDSTWAYFKLLPQVSFSVIENSRKWSQDWTIIYLIWWIAWAPFVGPFIARISRGRSIRQFLFCTIIIPTFASIIWFSGFADSVFNAENTKIIIDSVNNDYTQGLFTLFAQLPMGKFFSAIALLLLITFVITSADSALYVTGLFTNNLSVKNKLAWSSVFLAVSLALISINDVDLNKQIAISGAIPFTLIMFFQIVHFIFLESRIKSPV
ncbi:MAG: BCCT family transporter [Ostreibacterium sp.]